LYFDGFGVKAKSVLASRKGGPGGERVTGEGRGRWSAELGVSMTKGLRRGTSRKERERSTMGRETA